MYKRQAPPRPAGGRGEGDWTVEWMKDYAPALKDLKLSEMSLPGTHDSGTAKMVSQVEVLLVFFGTCGGDAMVRWVRDR